MFGTWKFTVIAILASLPAFCQGPESYSGRIVDGSGAAVAGASIQVLSALGVFGSLTD